MTIAGVGIVNLVEVVIVSTIAGIVVTSFFSVAILAGVRAGDARRAHDGARRAGWSLLAALAFAGVLAGVFAGLHVVAT